MAEWTLAELVGRLTGGAYPPGAVVTFDIRMTWPSGYHARLVHPIPVDVEEGDDD